MRFEYSSNEFESKPVPHIRKQLFGQRIFLIESLQDCTTKIVGSLANRQSQRSRSDSVSFVPFQWVPWEKRASFCGLNSEIPKILKTFSENRPLCRQWRIVNWSQLIERNLKVWISNFQKQTLFNRTYTLKAANFKLLNGEEQILHPKRSQWLPNFLIDSISHAAKVRLS